MSESTTASESVKAHCPPRFDVDDMNQAEKMITYLEDHGYAVVANVASEEQINRAKAEFWDFAEKYSPGLKRDDPSSWNNDNWLANPKTGIISGRSFNHSDFLWNSRLLPKVRRAFELVWGVIAKNDQSMLVSFDGGNAFRPWKRDPTWTTDGGWWHVDQNSRNRPHRSGRVCVQGLVTYYDADAETGGLCVVPGSHRQHQELCERTNAARMGMDFVSIDSADPVLRAGGVLVCARAGDLILWDSRTVHCNTPALTWTPRSEPPGDGEAADLIRLVAYVCMLPRSRVADEMLPRRRGAFEHRMPTAHWPDMAPPLPPADRAPERDPAECPREMLDLVGYPAEVGRGRATAWAGCGVM